MSHHTSATVIADSITKHGDATRLTSMLVVFPKMILGERNRHRGFSLSDRSSRAVPPEKLIQEVRDDPAMPAKFRARTKGMGGGDLLDGNFDCLNGWWNSYCHLKGTTVQQSWKEAANVAADIAEAMAEAGLAKEIANRPLDPFIRMKSLMTATRDVWMNFFGLRLDAAADPTIQVLAQRCFDAYKGSIPKLLRPGEWHLPFVNISDEIERNGWTQGDGSEQYDTWDDVIDRCLKLSAARCAHLSYESTVDGEPLGVERALSIYDKLVGSRPMHLSPLEHQATPDRLSIGLDGGRDERWLHAEQHGNLFGWIQHRKMLHGEAVAPLPERYR